ncbi:hypothetical protein T492DRAFT_1149268 [Pavlovales sp. CCMP2436]|nr:hypothetical protein T492DRAFT_1149268 [Pavlovales sp. CCMP2436]
MSQLYIHIGVPQIGGTPNAVRTTRYTPLSFLPRFLLEQLSRAANVYFLLLVLLQNASNAALATQAAEAAAEAASVPAQAAARAAAAGVSSMRVVGDTLVPLVLVLTLTAVKQIYDDLARARDDERANMRVAHVLRTGVRFTPLAWGALRPGDVVLLADGDAVPADLVLISTSGHAGQSGQCVVDTSAIDGETVLKSRSALPELNKLGRRPMALGTLCDTLLTYKQPNGGPDKFSGVVAVGDRQLPLTAASLLVRGMVLRNTQWAVGVAVFTGHACALLAPPPPPPSRDGADGGAGAAAAATASASWATAAGASRKPFRLERELNSAVLLAVLALLLLCAALTTAGLHWRAFAAERQPDAWYFAISPRGDFETWPSLHAAISRYCYDKLVIMATNTIILTIIIVVIPYYYFGNSPSLNAFIT